MVVDIGCWCSRFSFVVLELISVIAAWSIASGESGWSRGDAIAVAGVAAAIAAGLAAQFGTPLFERWLDRGSAEGPHRTGGDHLAVATDLGVAVVAETVTTAGRDLIGRDSVMNVTIGNLVAQPAPSQSIGQIVVGEIPGQPPAFVERDAVRRLAARV